jgi:hypothetical protein
MSQRRATYHVMYLSDNLSVAKGLVVGLSAHADIRMQQIVEWAKQAGISEDAQHLQTTISISRSSAN